MTDEYSLLEIVKLCNTVPDINALISAEKAYRFLLNDDTLVGVLSNTDIAPLEAECAKHMEPLFVFDHSLRTVVFGAFYDTQEKRSAALAEILSKLRAQNKWATLAKWRGETFPVFGDKSQPNEVAVWVERAASSNFGIRAYGVHINGITWSKSGELLMWVAKRSMSKSTWPGHLDQMAAGGIGNGLGILESAIKECEEEAKVPRDIAMKAKLVGTTGYFMRSELGLHPETPYVFDLELPLDFVPVPNDGEVEEFYLWEINKVISSIKKKLFKPNCALCIVDFLIRHGIVTAENEPNYIEIINNIHRPLPFPGPRRV
ncbi:NUDIX hydrolase domain-like protein [Coemansia spiralis]|nr:NUDIX hydrolase domain-like protein [Coemansia spiralis]